MGGRRDNPASPYAAVAQLVEQWTENPRVNSSILFGGNSVPGLSRAFFFGHAHMHLHRQKVVAERKNSLTAFSFGG